MGWMTRGAAARAAVLGGLVAVAAGVGAPAASAHGTANCTGTIAPAGSSLEGACVMPFRGLPIGVAGVFTANPESPRQEAEVHVEVLAKLAFAPPRPVGIECTQTGTGEARCTYAHNPLPNPLEGPEPLPAEILALHCNAHSHAAFSRFYPPSGAFACWSGESGRADLEAHGFFAANGF